MSHDAATKATPETEKMDLRSHDIAANRLQELLRLFPEIRTESGKFDLDRLKLAVGQSVDVGKERYGMNWPGKADCFKTIQVPSIATLRPVPDNGVSHDFANNLIIEGDNLEVLKQLQKSYLGRVKLIYIDPPYNTGTDFIYPDNFTENLQTYLEYTHQLDAEGSKFGTNTETDGRFHSKWLNMMYPRLYLARNLLRDDGFIFISIDDHEVANLRMVCNEIFGEDNFIANVIWQKKYTRSNDAKYFSDNHDHILVYARTKDSALLNLQQRSDDQTSAYSNPDKHPKGPWKATPLHAKSGSVTGFRYKFRNGVEWSPPSGTYPRFSRETLDQMDRDNEIWFGNDGKATPSRKTFLSEAKAGVTPITIWTYDEVGHTHEANNELKELDLGGIFDNPKPTRLIRRMLELATNGSDEHIILDFFAGSGTTAQAVLEANREDGGNRQFILVQLPEPTDRGGFNNIAAMTRERVKRVIRKQVEAAPTMFSKANDSAGEGFKAFSLDLSNFTEWDAGAAKKEADLVRQLQLHVDHVRKGRSSIDILYEVLIKSGFPLTAKVDEVKIADKVAYSVQDGAMILCLDSSLSLESVRALAKLSPERVVCLDAAFSGSDQLKANATQIFKTKGITFRTI